MTEKRYTISIEVTEQVERLTARAWEKGGPDGKGSDGEYGYTPQIPELKQVTRTILKMDVATLETDAVVAAILDASTNL